MLERAKGTIPLALSIGVLAFLWVEFSLNFTFHWFTNGDLGNGLSLPGNFHLVVATAFISWGFFFAAGADMAALRKVAIASVVGTVGALLTMWIAPNVADLPDFWGIAVTVGVIAFLVIVASSVGDWFYVPGIFGAFAGTVLWWIATGLDGWAKGGGGTGTGLKSLAAPTTAGTGAFGGILSTPYFWVFVSSLATLLIGCVLGVASVRLAGLVTPRAASHHREPEPAHV